MAKRYPFKFLNAYSREDTDIFFGRNEEVDRLYQMAFQSDILLVYGGSGTGKTSLINCGLASRFQSHDWLALNIRRGTDLNVSLEEKLKAAAGQPVPLEDNLDWLDEDGIDKAPQSELARRFKDIYLQSFRPIYLIFDQFEELYVLGTKQEQARFIQTVQEILSVDQPTKMIFIIREEYLGHLFEFERAVPQLLRKKLRIEPMNLDKVRQVIEGAAGLPRSNIFLQVGEEGPIVEGIFTKIKGEEKTLSIQLPYLQVFLDKLYLHLTHDEHRQADATFTLAALSEIGDMGDVLRDFLEEQASRIQQQLARQHPSLPDDAIWQVLSPLATLEGTKEPLSQQALLQRLPALPAPAIAESLQALESSRILRYEENEGLYEIAHDSLAQRIAERRSDDEIALLEIRRLIKGQAALKADARELFTEKQLNFMEPFLDKLGLNEEEHALIEESHRAVAAQKEAAERQAAAERERLLERQRLLEKSQQAQRRFIGLMGVALIAMIALAVWAYGQRRSAIISAEAATEAAEMAQQSLQGLKKEQALAKANELEAFGDSYLDLGKTDYACDSYRNALVALEEFSETPLFKALLQKRKATCE